MWINYTWQGLLPETLSAPYTRRLTTDWCLDSLLIISRLQTFSKCITKDILSM